MQVGNEHAFQAKVPCHAGLASHGWAVHDSITAGRPAIPVSGGEANGRPVASVMAVVPSAHDIDPPVAMSVPTEVACHGFVGSSHGVDWNIDIESSGTQQL